MGEAADDLMQNIFGKDRADRRCRHCNRKAPFVGKPVCERCRVRIANGEELERFRGYAYLRVAGEANAK